jgi:hypothetical protein
VFFKSGNIFKYAVFDVPAFVLQNYAKGVVMKRLMFIICVLFFITGASLFAQPESIAPSVALKLDLPLFSLLYQIDMVKISEYGFFDSYTHPDMAASLAVTGDVYSSFHFGMKKLRDFIGQNAYWKRLVYLGSVGLGDFLLYVLPFPTSYMWMHESFHRAGFTHMGLRSHINFDFPNGGYAMVDSGGDIYKYDLPRVSAAGIESEYLLIEKMQMNNFFYDQGMLNEFFYWLANIQALGYAYMSFQNEGMTMTVEGKEQEFSADSLQWAYYLFHPEEHITMNSEDDEVIGLSDLKDNEKEFLKNRVMWSLVNFASPMMFGIRSIPLWAGFSGNFALRQLYTSMQPKDQEFTTGKPEFFARAGCRVGFAISKHFLPYLEINVKTDGWVAGNEFLERNINFKPVFPRGFSGNAP